MEGVEDQGAKMLSAIASVVGVGAAGEDKHEMARRLDALMDTIAIQPAHFTDLAWLTPC
jgi:hypothetical protein